MVVSPPRVDGAASGLPPSDDDRSGLTDSEARRRLVDGGPNEIASAERHGLFQTLLGVLREPMLLLLAAAAALYLVLGDAFDRIEAVMRQFDGGHFHEVLTVGAVGTFAVGWLMPRLKSFAAAHPFIELRMMTNNNLVDLAGEGLDFAIRFGDGTWPGSRALKLFDAPLSVLCAP